MILKWRTSGQRGVWESPGELHTNCIPYPHPVIPIAHTGTLLSSWDSVITLATPQSPLPETQYWLVILGTPDLLVLLSPLHLCFLSGATLHLLSLFNSRVWIPAHAFLRYAISLDNLHYSLSQFWLPPGYWHLPNLSLQHWPDLSLPKSLPSSSTQMTHRLQNWTHPTRHPSSTWPQHGT